MRRIPALVSTVALATVLAATLSGCSGSAAGGCEPTIASGDASALVTAPGAPGSQPTVDIPAPLVTTHGERSVITAGEGALAVRGDNVDFEATVVDGQTGTVLLQTQYSADALPVRGVAGRDGALFEALVCARVGERLSIVAPMGESGVDTTSVGVSDPEATIVFVVDVVARFPGRADGVNQLPQDGMPNVVTAPDGTPGITVPDAAPPAETRIATIKAGGGELVETASPVVVNIAVWVWPTDGDELRQVSTTWGAATSNHAITLPLVEDATMQAGITPGLLDAIVGTRVGSQVLAVVAPADSYAEGSWPAGASAGDTLIYVIDVLGVQTATK